MLARSQLFNFMQSNVSDFVKDPNMKISQLLKENNANILNFIRYEVGEGIEVEKVDFATEVMSQIEG